MLYPPNCESAGASETNAALNVALVWRSYVWTWPTISVCRVDFSMQVRRMLGHRPHDAQYMRLSKSHVLFYFFKQCNTRAAVQIHLLPKNLRSTYKDFSRYCYRRPKLQSFHWQGPRTASKVAFVAGVYARSARAPVRLVFPLPIATTELNYF